MQRIHRIPVQTCMLRHCPVLERKSPRDHFTPSSCQLFQPLPSHTEGSLCPPGMLSVASTSTCLWLVRMCVCSATSDSVSYTLTQV